MNGGFTSAKVLEADVETCESTIIHFIDSILLPCEIPSGKFIQMIAFASIQRIQSCLILSSFSGLKFAGISGPHYQIYCSFQAADFRWTREMLSFTDTQHD